MVLGTDEQSLSVAVHHGGFWFLRPRFKSERDYHRIKESKVLKHFVITEIHGQGRIVYE